MMKQEIQTKNLSQEMVDIFLNTDYQLKDMCQCIVDNKKSGLYDGAYKVVELAMKDR